MKVDLTEIERKARAATPGNWTTVRPPDSEDGWATGVVVAAVAPRQLVYTDHQGGLAPEANRAHIAASSPLATIALVRRIFELENALHEALNWWSADMPDDNENRDRLRKIAEKGTVTT